MTIIIELLIETVDGAHPATTEGMRSRNAIAGGIAVLTALPLAIVSALVLGGGDQVVVHAFLGLGMILLFLATTDFRVPGAITWLGRAGMVGLGSIFLLQGLADAVQWPPLLAIAYGDPTLQLIEKVSAYPILLWFVGLLFSDSMGKTRIFGGVVLGSIIVSELYSLWLTLNGGSPDIMLRALYLPLFVWLALEGAKPRHGTN